MTDSTAHSDDELKRALQGEAAGLSPVFSPQLHQSVMARIGQPLSGSGRHSRRLRWVASLALVAAAVFAVMVLNRAATEVIPSTAHRTIARIPTLPGFEKSVDAVSRPLDDGLMNARYAYLDRDAGRITKYLATQMDLLP